MINLRKGKKEKSILFWLFTGVLVTVLVQCTLVGCAILISRVVPNLNENAYEIFYQTINNRKNYIENEMHNRWSSIEADLQGFEKMYPETDEILTEEQALAYLSDVSAPLIAMLRSSTATGAFIILNDGGTDTSNSCLYFTDTDPQHNDTLKNSDLQILKGPLELTRTLKIPLHISWNYGITLTDDIKDVYGKPYGEAQKGISKEHLGYWSVVPSIYAPNTSSIVYTKPLCGKDGQVFGVAGIEVSQEYFYRQLPVSELSEEGFGGYAIIADDGEGGYVPIMTQGAKLQQMIPYGKPLTLTVENEKFNGCVMTTAEGGEMSACFQPIALYNKNTPFSDTGWYLLGVAPLQGITRYSDTLQMALTAAITASVGIGVLLSILMGVAATRSTSVLIRRIRDFVPGQKLLLNTTGISEINELSAAVEQLNDKVLSYALRTDKIISMVNIDIGFFEYNIPGGLVKLTPVLARMGDFVLDKADCVPTVDFNRWLDRIRRQKTGENIYRYKEDPPRWLKLEAVGTDSARFGVVVDVTQDELTKKAIAHERDHDALTGIYNRYAFQRHLKEVFDKRAFTNGAFVMGDLDNLKHINDLYGHDFGDLYISKTAHVIGAFLEGKPAVYGRMSGDEFYMYIYGTSAAEIKKIVYDLHFRLNCENIDLPDGSIFKLKMSCGIAWYPKDSVLPEELIRYADFAMYQGKHSVKGGIREFESVSYNENSYMLTGKEELYAILDEQLCDYVFQPVYDVRNVNVYGYEALMRPYGKNVNTPDKLINLALAQGLLYKVEHNTFYMVLELCRKYMPLLKDSRVFINSVPNEVLKEEEYEELAHFYGDFLTRVVMEITERETINDEMIDRKKNVVQKWGAMLALDDYGSGCANDVSLLHLHPDIIKIDRLLIDGINADKDKRVLVSKTIAFAGEAGIEVLAEGVETREELETLMKLGIDYVQGYFISRPAPLPDFDDTEMADIVRTIQKQMKEK